MKDGNKGHIKREPERVKAFRDTWRDGIHSYLTDLRDRLTVARDLLADSGSIFVQIGDENVHCVRAVMDKVFAEYNFDLIRGLLVWATEPQIAPYRGEGPVAAGIVKLLLDGQQRITSLYGVARGHPPRFLDGNAQNIYRITIPF